MLVRKLIEIGSVALEKRNFLISWMYFCYFVIISPWKRTGPFIWINLNSHHPRMLCAKFGWNWPSGSGEEDDHVKSLQTDRQTDRRTDRQTDDGRQVIRKAHLSFQLRWAIKNPNFTLPRCHMFIWKFSWIPPSIMYIQHCKTHKYAISTEFRIYYTHCIWVRDFVAKN